VSTPLRRVVSWLLTAATLLVGPSARASEHADEASLGRDPPALESITVTLVDPAAGRLRTALRFRADPRLGAVLELDVGDGPTRFTRVAGDPDAARFVGEATLDLDALHARLHALRRLERRLGRPLEVAIVKGRTVPGVKALPRFPWGALFTGQPVLLPATVASADEVAADRSLLVTDASVVGDPTRTWDPCTGSGTPLGVWTFGHVMQRIASQAGSTDAAGFTRTWLAEWESDQSINGWTVPKRDVAIGHQLLDDWPRTGGGTTGPLDLAQAPFKLLAIVNRIDLADNLAYGAGGGSAGEVRFVFGAIRKGPRACVPLRMTVIVEMAIHETGCKALQQWAQAWIALGTFTLPDPAYNAALAALTEQAFVAPNGLGQVRTNEIDLTDLATTPAPVPWELREFHLAGGILDEVPVAQTPGETVNRQQIVADFVNTFAPTIVADRHVVTALHPAVGGSRFLGARALTLDGTPNTPGTFWSGPTQASIADPEARHHFSLNTCSGCHGGETATHFTHVNPLAPPGSPAQLSSFLTGVVDDPNTGQPIPFEVADPETGVLRPFNDLLRRRQRLAELAGPCLLQLPIVPMKMSH
jgi:hypothetical protein